MKTIENSSTNCCCNIFQLLLNAGIKVSVEDNEGNTPLHVKCYGETGKSSEIEAIQLLLGQGAKLTVRNSRVSKKILYVLLFIILQVTAMSKMMVSS